LTVRAAPAVAAVLCALVLSACANTVQDEPIGAAPFESVLVNSRFPVYWLGLRFERLEASSVREDPSGAVTIDYGDCVVGGQYTCVPTLQVVTSPDNSFIPGEGAASRVVPVRGAKALSIRGGQTLAVATGPVVVSVYAKTPALALAAMQTMTTLNLPGASGAPLAPPLADTGFDRLALRSQVPAGQSVPRGG
jgi:hypothetical protein